MFLFKYKNKTQKSAPGGHTGVHISSFDGDFDHTQDRHQAVIYLSRYNLFRYPVSRYKFS